MERRGETGKGISIKGMNWDESERRVDIGHSRAEVTDREKEGENAWEVLME